MPLGGFYQTGTIAIARPTVTITIASPGVINAAAHGLAAGDPVQLSTTGALPTGLAPATTYYVVNPTTDTFQLAAVVGGAAINTSGSQSGVHTLTTNLVVGSGTLWTLFGLQDDEIYANGATGLINSVVDDTHIKLVLPWTGGALSGAPYVLRQRSWQRYDPALTQATTRQLLALIAGAGLIYYPPGSPDNGVGEDGQVAIKFTSVGGGLVLQMWIKVSGVWVLQSTPWPSLAAEADAEAGTSGALALSPLTGSQLLTAQPLGFKNIAGRNGGFEVWQRTSPIAVAAAATAYSVDGWYLLTGANQAATVTKDVGLTNGSAASAIVARNNGQTGTGVMRFAMPLDTDEVKKAAGNAIVLSFVVAAGGLWSPAGGTLNYAVYFGTGAVGKRGAMAFTGETAAITGSVNLVPAGAAVQVVSAISAAVPANVTQGEIQFSWTPVGTAGASDRFWLDDLDLRVVPAGIAAAKPAFERSDYVWDYLRCARHLFVLSALASGVSGSHGFGQAFSTTSAFFVIWLPVPPRKPPAVLLSSPGDYVLSGPTANFLPVTSLGGAFSGIGNSIQVNANAAAGGLTPGNATGFFPINANARIYASMEI